MSKKKSILIVDDEFFLAETLKGRLEHNGYSVFYAENGAMALSVLEKTPCDLILMDAIMPVMDGLEATKQIKAQKKLKKIPIIFLTVRARPEDRQAALSLGANDYITKPFESETLMSKVEEWLKK